VRRLSIGLRTALTFGAVFVVLAGLVLWGVSAATSRGVSLSLQRVDDSGTPATPSDEPGSPVPDGFVPTGADPAGSGPGGAVTSGGAPTVAPERIVAGVLRQQQLLWSGVGVGVAGVVAAGVGWFVSRRLLRPVDDIVAATRRITASTLHERIGAAGPSDELSRVAATIDDLLDRLESSFEAQRRFVAFASHELRTPLAVQRAALQIGLDDPTPEQLAATRDQLLEVNRRSEHLVESLLALATADRGLAADLAAPVDLGAVVDEVVTGVADLARASSVHLIVDHGSFRSVTGDAVLVGQLVRNLVANAVEYNEPGGWVRVHGGDDGVLVVENSGPVVPGEVAATLTQAFVRGGGRPADAAGSAGSADGAAGGAAPVRHSGLGLAIVASIARAHGWSLHVEPRDEGGLRVRVGPCLEMSRHAAHL
jgi:signal transduction histidine kinase